MSDKPKTIEIKIHVIANADGKWAAYGWTEGMADARENLQCMMENVSPAPEKFYVVTVEIPLPQAEEVIGVVGEVSESET